MDLDGNRSRLANGRAGFAGKRSPRAFHSCSVGSRSIVGHAWYQGQPPAGVSASGPAMATIRGLKAT